MSGGHRGSSAVDGCLLPLSPGLSWRDRPDRPPSGRPLIALQRPSASLALPAPRVLPEWPSIQGNAGHTQWPPLGSPAPACPWPRPHAPPPAQPQRPSTRARLLILRRAGTQMLRRRLRPLPGPSAQLPRPGPPPAEGPSLPPVVPWLSASTPWLSSRSGCCNGCVAPGPRDSACPAPMALAPRLPCPDCLPKARRDRPCSINQSRAGQREAPPVCPRPRPCLKGQRSAPRAPVDRLCLGAGGDGDMPLRCGALGTRRRCALLAAQPGPLSPACPGWERPSPDPRGTSLPGTDAPSECLLIN